MELDLIKQDEREQREIGGRQRLESKERLEESSEALC